MSAPKHTPGPWVVRRSDVIWPEYAEIDGPGWGNLASVTVIVDGVPCAEGEANARLIAAAPGLLALLAETQGVYFPAEWRERRNALLNRITAKNSQ